MSRRKKKEGEAEGETEGGVERRETKREDAAEVNGRGGGVRPVVVSGKWKEQTCAHIPHLPHRRITPPPPPIHTYTHTPPSAPLVPPTLSSPPATHSDFGLTDFVKDLIDLMPVLIDFASSLASLAAVMSAFAKVKYKSSAPAMDCVASTECCFRRDIDMPAIPLEVRVPFDVVTS